MAAAAHSFTAVEVNVDNLIVVVTFLSLVAIALLSFWVKKLKAEICKIEGEKKTLTKRYEAWLNEHVSMSGHNEKEKLKLEINALRMENIELTGKIATLRTENPNVHVDGWMSLIEQINLLELTNKRLEDENRSLRGQGFTSRSSNEVVETLKIEKIVQSQCTYSSLRGVSKPSFEFLRRGEDGAWDC